MRLMLGNFGNPQLLIDVADNYDKNKFKFYVINGAWYGEYENGNIRISAEHERGDEIVGTNIEILTDDQNRLRCPREDYNDVFVNFSNPRYVGPEQPTIDWSDMDDDIAF
jgi:hypothetical protein